MKRDIAGEMLPTRRGDGKDWINEAGGREGPSDGEMRRTLLSFYRLRRAFPPILRGRTLGQGWLVEFFNQLGSTSHGSNQEREDQKASEQNQKQHEIGMA
jgi:hypothetical protein